MKTICITPIDEGIRVHIEALNIKNEFKRLGFSTVSGFVGVVQDNLPGYKDYNDMKRLLQFWSGRLKNDDFNQELTKLLESLKAE